MVENNSKFPKFFIYMFTALLLIMIVCAFLSVSAVGIIYFAMLLVVVVFILFDFKYNFFITNYKPIFFMFDLSMFLASLTVLCYEYSNHSLTLLVFLFMNVGISVIMLTLDALVLENKNKGLYKKECLAIDFLQICSMICLLTYFYKVSTFWYSIVAFVSGIVNVSLKIYFSVILKKRGNTEREIEKDYDETIDKLEKIDDEGEVE